MMQSGAKVRAGVSCVVALLASCAAVAVAQEGHPMVGTWSGDWSPSPKEQVAVLFVMEWKNKALVGVMNPGLDDEVPVKGVLDSTRWSVRLEADSKNERGAAVKVVFEGTLEDIGSYNRYLTGTLTRGGIAGRLKLTRE